MYNTLYYKFKIASYISRNNFVFFSPKLLHPVDATYGCK